MPTSDPLSIEVARMDQEPQPDDLISSISISGNKPFFKVQPANGTNLCSMVLGCK